MHLRPEASATTQVAPAGAVYEDIALVGDDLLRVARGHGVVIRVNNGEVWVTQDRDHSDYTLRSGESFTIQRTGVTLVQARRVASVTVSVPPGRDDVRVEVQPTARHGTAAGGFAASVTGNNVMERNPFAAPSPQPSPVEGEGVFQRPVRALALTAIDTVRDALSVHPGSTGDAAMPKPSTNVLLYLPSPRDEIAIGELEKTLPTLHGVSRVQRGGKLPSVVLVDYDPSRTSPYSILAHVLGLGVAARLVGM